MTHWYKYFILLLIPIVFGCGSNSSDNKQNDTENEDFQISDVGDINGDGIQDSVVLCDSLVVSNKEEMTASKMSVIDNDTMLKMEAVNGNRTSVKLCFMKKGLSQKVINAIKHDFLNPNLRKWEYKYNYSNISDREMSEDTSFEDVFYKSKEFLEEESLELEGFREYETYRIMPIYENDHFVTYLFEYESFDCRACYYTFFITYDKKTGKSFSWDMIRKNDDFRSLLMSYLLKKKDIEEGRFKYSECSPFIDREDSLCIYYHRYEITDDCIEGCPEAIIPLNEIEPFLTKEGKKFLRR